MILWLCFLAAIIGGDHPDFKVTVTPSASQISIKDTLKVDLDLTFPEGYSVDLEKLRQNVFHSSSFYGHSFAIADMKVHDPRKQADGLLSQHIALVLQPLRMGSVDLSFRAITFIPSDKKNDPQTFISPIFPIEVLSIEGSSHFQGHLTPLLAFSKSYPLELSEQNQNLLESPDVLQQERHSNVVQMNKKRLPWIEIGGAALVALAIWVFLKYPSIKPPLTAEQIAQKAKENALSKLNQLQSKNLPEKGFFDEFYVELTTPVRIYIEKRYSIEASTRTTSEFLAETSKNAAFPEKTRQQLELFLHQADKVKFGRYQPSIEECELAHDLAIQFIKTDPLSFS